MRLTVGGLAFSYGSERVLDDVSFEINAGDVVAILGRNGAGKSTLLRCMNGILRPERGTVDIDGSTIGDMPRREVAKEIGYVAQRGEPSRITVFESVLLGRRPHIDFDAKDSDLALAGRVIDLVGLSRLSGKYVDEISGGEYQLVQIARALVQHPKVILFDEPTNNLDPANQHSALHLIANIVKANGMAAVMVIHDLNLAIGHADKFVMMREGRIFACGGREVLTPEIIEFAYGLECYIGEVHGIPVIVPKEEHVKRGVEPMHHRAHDAQTEFFDRYAERWDEVNHGDPGKISYIADLLALKGGESILDVGTGTGVMVPYYEERMAGEVTAIDLSPKMVEVARRKFPEADHPRVRFEVHDMYAFDEGSYDRVVCYSCFPHFPDKQRAIDRLASLLKPDGKLMVAHSDSRDDIARIHSDAGDAVGHDVLPSEAEMREMFSKAGLDVYFARDDGDYFIVVGGRSL